MATYAIKGVYGSELVLEVADGSLSVGDRFMLSPTWDVDTSGRTFTFTDDDANLSGDNFSDESGNDANQTVVVTDAAGSTLASGKVYLEWAATFSAPDGTTINMYVVEIGGVVWGEVFDHPIIPGVTYQVSGVPDVTTGPVYTALQSMAYDPDLVNNFQGSQYKDSIQAGAGDDSIRTGAGADYLAGGDGNDTLVYGEGGASQAEGDTVYGGAGNDSIDDIEGTIWNYNDALYGEAGNDTIWGGLGNDTIDGGADNDSIMGEDGNDTIYGGTGGDTIYGGTGADYIDGGDGVDVILGDDGNDTVYGGAGGDYLAGNGGNDVLYGGADADRLYLSDNWGSDTLYGDSAAGSSSDQDTLDFTYMSTAVSVNFTDSEDGTATNGANTATFDNIEAISASNYNDTINASADSSGVAIYGNGGADTITGGAGADTLYGGTGNDSIEGGGGNDALYGEAGTETLSGGTGNDTLTGGTGNDSLSGGDGADRFLISAGDGADTITGGEGGTDYDRLQFTSGASGLSVTYTGNEAGTYSLDGGTASGSFSQIEEIYGTAQADTVNASAASWPVTAYGEAGNDSLTGGAGNDVLDGGSGDDTLTGNAGNDSLTGGLGADSLSGGDGDDTFSADDGNDTVLAGSGNDSISGNDGNDSLSGEDGDDRLTGGAGDDTLLGGAGADSLSGGDGNDWFTGGTGNDTLTGGAGADTFSFGAGSGADRIADFDLTLISGRTLDQFDVSGLTNPLGGPLDYSNITVASDGAGGSVLTFPNGETVRLLNVQPSLVSSKAQMNAMGLPCFVAGTLILTPQGFCPVERLRVGDLVVLREGPPQPVLWAAARRVSALEMEVTPKLRPVEIRAGALGNGRGLRVSGLHGLYMPAAVLDPATREAGHLVRARHLARTGWGGAREMRHARDLSYHHLLLPRHGLLCAEGLWAESFWPSPISFDMLSPADRITLLCAYPNLSRAVFGRASVESAYGPRAAPVLPARRIDQTVCAKWSRLAQHVAVSGGYLRETNGQICI